MMSEETVLDSLLKYSHGLHIYRRLTFAAAQLPADLPGYWKEVAKFASYHSEIVISPEQARTFVDNLNFMNETPSASDSELWGELVGRDGSTSLVGLTLISPNSICFLCGSKLTVRKDRPSIVVMYTQSIGTVAAKHYRKVCSKARAGCSFVQHYGFYSEGQ